MECTFRSPLLHEPVNAQRDKVQAYMNLSTRTGLDKFLKLSPLFGLHREDRGRKNALKALSEFKDDWASRSFHF